jgi:hypothetical protein
VHAVLLYVALDQVHGRRADEAGDEQVARRVVQRAAGVALLQEAVLQYRNAVAHRHGLDLVVGHVDGGNAEAGLQRRNLGARRDAELGVEVRERLVHQEDLGERTMARPMATRCRCRRRAPSACG